MRWEAVSAASELSRVPYAILLATMLQASRLLARREDAQGSLTVKEVDDVRYQWGNPSTELDADVVTSVASYRRVWGAA